MSFLKYAKKLVLSIQLYLLKKLKLKIFTKKGIGAHIFRDLIIFKKCSFKNILELKF